VNRYARDLLRRFEEGQIDPSYIITHRARLSDGPGLYELSRQKGRLYQGRSDAIDMIEDFIPWIGT
jgi:hypothetical protein